MASGYSPWYKRKILYHIPGLFKKCPGSNYHWFWDRLCWCRWGEYDGSKWHGGIYDFRTGNEYQECETCKKVEQTLKEDDLHIMLPNPPKGFDTPGTTAKPLKSIDRLSK